MKPSFRYVSDKKILLLFFLFETEILVKCIQQSLPSPNRATVVNVVHCTAVSLPKTNETSENEMNKYTYIYEHMSKNV